MLGINREVIVEPVPANPGYMAYTKDQEELYGTSWGPTPETARQAHVKWMEFIDEHLQS